MPLIRIEISKNGDRTPARGIGAIIYESLRYTIDIPHQDNFQLLT